MSEQPPNNLGDEGEGEEKTNRESIENEPSYAQIARTLKSGISDDDWFDRIIMNGAGSQFTTYLQKKFKKEYGDIVPDIVPVYHEVFSSSTQYPESKDGKYPDIEKEIVEFLKAVKENNAEGVDDFVKQLNEGLNT